MNKNFNKNFLKDSTNYNRASAFNYLPKSTKHSLSKNFILSKQTYGSGSNILKKSSKKTKEQLRIKGMKSSQSPIKLDHSQVPFRAENSLDVAGRENSKYSIDTSQRRKAKKNHQCLMKTNYTNLKKLINQVTSLSPRGKYISSPKNRSKIMKKKKEAGKSKIIRCNSSLTMFQNSISDGKKKTHCHKSRHGMKNHPYSSTQNLLSSTMATSHPTIAMFNSLIKNRKNSSKKRKKSKSNKSRASQEKNSASNRPSSRTSLVHAKPLATSDTLQKFLNKPKGDINTLVINICNDKPLMIKVNKDGHENKEILLNCPKNLPRKHKNTTPPFTKDLEALKQRFTRVLNGYQQRLHRDHDA
ncbi:unnamed protein product [Moneuplotes crassus]|uniref:Uncharacterized protein n=1 Tax=Euplotes crassus TaxID=5936 RepID=A0AAD1UFI2_EUPCR|nr:unnamed protein product [Moneuplotes crassus]